jgi:hypothetical protein
LSLTACGGTGLGGKPPSTAAGVIGPFTPTAVDDAAFAPSTYRILVGADSGQTRASLLAGVVARQLERARQRFESERADVGYAGLQGAFFLMRRGEYRREAFLRAAPALEHGAAVAARLGEEGYSLALYT